MLVSIVTPCYNSEHFIETTYNSIKAQSYTNWEWIVIDDASSDKSLEIIKSYAKTDDRIIVLENKKGLGPGPTRNKGIEAAKGKYLTFIDSDDVWHPNFIEKSIATMKEKDAGFTFASYERHNEDFSEQFDDFIVPDRLDYKQLLYTCPISCLTAFIDIEKYGKLKMPDLPKRQDYALWLEYLKIIPFAYGIKEPLAKYRIRTSSVSSNKRKVIKYQFKVYYEHQKLGLFKSLFYLSSWAYHGFKKYRKI